MAEMDHIEQISEREKKREAKNDIYLRPLTDCVLN